MNYEKAIKALTDEIVNEFRLPKTLCYMFIRERIQRAFAVGFDVGRMQRTHSRRRSVLQYTKTGRLVAKYDTTKDAARAIDVDSSNITKVCKGKLHSIGGFVFKYQNKKSPVTEPNASTDL